MNRKKRQLLYVIEAGGVYKIGISNDVNSRLRSLQTGSAYKVSCIAYYRTETVAKEVESKLHKLFSKFRLEGEWFDFKGRFTIEAFNKLCNKYGMEQLEFNADGSCRVLYEEEKQIVLEKPDLSPESIAYWRRYYGIKPKYKR